MGKSPRCLYYAFGGGLGHGVRTLALARQLARLVGGRHHILLNTPFADTLHGELARQPLIQLHVLSGQNSPAEATRYVHNAIESLCPDIFIVDTFPRGLGGEFVSAFSHWRFGSRILISRTLPNRYVEEYQLSDFVLAHYDDVIVPGEASPFADLIPVHSTAPFLIRDYCELPPIDDAAKLVRSQADRPVVLFVGAGTVGECLETAQLAEAVAAGIPARSPIRLALPVEVARDARQGEPLVVRHFPLIECLAAVRLVVGSGGYNVTHEARAIGVPAIAQPRRRKYDRQSSRVPSEQRYYGLDDLRYRLATELAKPLSAIRQYRNGAADAARHIAESF